MEELRKELKCQFIKPFRFDSNGGFIFDSNNQMVGEVRGWGHLSKFPNASFLQDELGEMLTEGLNIVFEQQLSKQETIEGFDNFVDNCFKSELNHDESVAIALLQKNVFSHYILIPKEK